MSQFATSRRSSPLFTVLTACLLAVLITFGVDSRPAQAAGVKGLAAPSHVNAREISIGDVIAAHTFSRSSAYAFTTPNRRVGLVESSGPLYDASTATRREWFMAFTASFGPSYSVRALEGGTPTVVVDRQFSTDVYFPHSNGAIVLPQTSFETRSQSSIFDRGSETASVVRLGIDGRVHLIEFFGALVQRRSWVVGNGAGSLPNSPSCFDEANDIFYAPTDQGFFGLGIDDNLVLMVEVPDLPGPIETMSCSDAGMTFTCSNDSGVYRFLPSEGECRYYPLPAPPRDIGDCSTDGASGVVVTDRTFDQLLLANFDDLDFQLRSFSFSESPAIRIEFVESATTTTIPVTLSTALMQETLFNELGKLNGWRPCEPDTSLGTPNLYALQMDGDAFQGAATYGTGPNTKVAFIRVEPNDEEPPVDTEPPVVSCSVATNVLWPPNGDFINVGLQVHVTENQDPDPEIEVFVYANLDQDARRSARSMFPETLRLEAKRDVGALGGSLRVYLIVVKAWDASGNVGYCVSTVVVPLSPAERFVEQAQNEAAYLTQRYNEIYAPLHHGDMQIVSDSD